MNDNQNSKRRTIIAVTVAVYAVLALFFYIIVNNKAISAWIRSTLSVLAPLIIGTIIAFLCSPIMNVFEKRLFRAIKSKHLRRVLSIVFTYLLVFLCITIILLIIIPQIVSSFNGLLDNYGLYLNQAIVYVNNILSKFDRFLPEFKLEITPEGIIQELGDWLNDYAKNIKTSIGDYIKYAGQVASVAMNILLGFFISVYILSSKERLAAQLKKAAAAFLSESQYKSVLEWSSFTNKTFGRYIKAQLLDALLVAIECGIIFAIFKIPFPVLLAFIIGVTNIIPVFGPFIGGIPAGFIVLITDPGKLPWFVLMLVLIQQVDGNIILPKLVGSTTGMTSFGVLCAITIMGGYFGVLGMILGVPIFALASEIIRAISNSLLAKKGLSVSLADYYTPEAVIIGADLGEPPRRKLIPRIILAISGFFKRLFKIKSKKISGDGTDGNNTDNDNKEESENDSTDDAGTPKH